MTVRLSIAVVATLFLLGACGSSSSTSTPSLTVSPSSATVAAGSSAQSFSAALSDATGTVSWSLTGPGSIAPSSGPTTAYTPPATGASSAQATLTATAAGLSASATITVSTAATITVTGAVVHMDGLPIPNITVAIGSSTATTDASGHFTIPNVTTPYDVLLFHVPANGPLSGVYKGLTRPDPKLLSFGSDGSKNRSGGVSGSVSGGDPLSTVNDGTRVAFASPEALMDWRLTVEENLRVYAGLYGVRRAAVGRAMEALAAIAAPVRIRALDQDSAMRRLREARSCYDHLAGRIGVAVADRLAERNYVRLAGGAFTLTPANSVRRRASCARRSSFSGTTRKSRWRMGARSRARVNRKGVNG